MTVVHYRTCSRENPPTVLLPRLSDAVVRVMQKEIGPNVRVNQRLSERRQQCSDNHEIFLNTYTQSPGWCFAEFLRAEPGAFVVTVRANEEVLEIFNHEMPQGNLPHRGSLYALFHGEHVLFATKGHFSARNLEEYLTWFLRKDAAVLAPDRHVVLAARTPAADRFRANRVRIRLNPFQNEDGDGNGEIDDLQDDEADRPTSAGIMRSLLVADADLRRMVEGGEVVVNVELKFKDGRNKRDLGVADLNEMFRNVEDVDAITFDGPDGPISPLGARLRGNKTIASIGSVLNATDARTKLVEQFDEWRISGHIAADPAP